MRVSGESSPCPLTVVIPAYNAAATLPACLSALARSERRPDAIILFDDGSTDETARLASAAGAVVLSAGLPAQGPAIGRNIGAMAADPGIVVFVDADVAVWPDALAKLEAPLLAGEAVASFGSYDDRPKSRRLAALYANLRHHWVHQQGQNEAFTFWSGLGAIKTDTFRAQKGFDPHFDRPSIEDVELGIRIIESGGRIRLVKDALGSHHKDWGVAQLWTTDIFCRAIPWARLMMQGRGRADDLNISKRERASAVAAHLVPIAALTTLSSPVWWPALMIAGAGYVVLNARFFAFLIRSGGMRAGIAGIFFHWCYHLYASVAYALVATRLLPDRRRSKITNISAGKTQATRP